MALKVRFLKARLDANIPTEGLIPGGLYYAEDTHALYYSGEDGLRSIVRSHVHANLDALNTIPVDADLSQWMEDFEHLSEEVDMKAYKKDVEELVQETKEVLEAEIQESVSVREYKTKDLFPEVGKEGCLYIESDTGIVYRWNGERYDGVGGYDIGFGLTIDDGVLSSTIHGGYGIGVNDDGEIYTTELSADDIKSICD